MPRREAHDLVALGEEEGIGADNKRPDLPLHQRGESRIDLALGASLRNLDLNSLAVGRYLRVEHHALSIRVVRVHQEGDGPGVGQQLRQQVKPLGHELDVEDADPRKVASRSGQAFDQASCYWIAASDKDDGYCLSCSSRCQCSD